MTKDRIIKAYARIAKAEGRYPTRAELLKAGISRDSIRSNFGNLDGLKEAAKEAAPKAFEKVIDPDNFNTEAFRGLQAEIKKYKRFVVTTAVAGAPVDKELLASIRTYCKKKKAKLLIIPANYALYEMDHDLVTSEAIVFKELKLNSNIAVNPIKIDPKAVDPTTGLDAFGQAQTVIIGSPKQRRIPIANSNNKLARIIQATGAITKPRYVPTDGIPKRRDTLAEIQHRMGGVIVEIKDSKYYHMRHFERSKDGSFNDLFVNYSSAGVKPAPLAAVVQGDKHVGDTDPAVNKAVDEMCAAGRPTYRIEHDFFNGASISHHSVHLQVERAIMAAKDKISLERELKITADEIKRVRNLGTAKVHVIVDSNHNDWLMQYLNKGDFSDQNRIISAELQVLAMKGHKPLKAAMESLFGVKPGSDLLWLDVDDDFRVAGTECGAHGHLGANGKRNPGAKGMYKGYGKVMFGHGHHGEIWHDSMMVGTSTYLKVGYNKGCSSWDNSQGLIYEDGTRQLVNVINGEWFLKD